MIDERKSERQAPRVQFENKVCDDATRHLVQRGCPGKERRRMAIVAEAEKNQIVLINWLTAPRGDGVQLVFVLLRCDLRIDFAGTAAGTKRFSRAILKLLRGSSGGTQRSSPKVKRTDSHGRS